MHKKRLAIMLPLLLCLITIPLVVQAATITTCVFDRDTYHQGETGYIKITIYNDKDSKIRVTELTATVDYFYTDGTIYLQTFFTNATLPIEIQQGQSNTFYILFSLPNNIASGYTEVNVKAKTELWNNQLERWFQSDQPTYQLILYIESPYKQQFEQQQTINDQLLRQLHELQMNNNNITVMLYAFGTIAMFFALMMVLFIIIAKRPKVIPPVA